MSTPPRAVAAVPVLLGAIATFACPCSSCADSVDRTLEVAPGKSLRYRLVTPNGFDPKAPTPVMLLLPPGGQDAAMVEAALGFVGPAAERRGWVVACPEAIQGEPFAGAGRAHLAPLIASIRSTLAFEGDRVHVAGISNGGRAALAFAVASPGECASILVFPGAFPSGLPKEAELRKLAAVPVRMFVGEKDDPAWREAGEQAVKALRKAGVDATLEVRPGQEHVIRDLSGDAILDMLDGFRPGRAPAARAGAKTEGDAAATAALTAEIARTLDELHKAASKPDEQRYFSLFAPGAVFIGTDATERWTIEEFRTYAHARFAEGKGWTYVPRARHVTVDGAAGYAFFDELLDNEKYGECRGSGVLRRVGDQWLIAQYHLTMPVPNDLLESVAHEIKRAAGTRQR
ncbi:MAG: nuclear transport factor 2 family protein [Phycisphaerales bacterium]